MINLRHYRRSLFPLALALVSAGGTVCAQELASAPVALPTLIDSKQAAKMVIERPAPEYPPIAKANYIAGQVQVELTVNDNGKVASAHVLEGNAILAASALNATRRWSYRPLATPSGPSGFVTRVRLKFILHPLRLDSMPQRAEQDFLRQVKPPQPVRPQQDSAPGEVVHIRLLVNEQGQVVDMAGSPTVRARFGAACETLRGWTFRPAHWGNIPIPSYLDVNVPFSAPSIARAAVNPGCW